MTDRLQPDWLAGLTHRDFLFDGYRCSETIWGRLDWSRAYVDMGPSIAGNLGPYWHVPLPDENYPDDPDSETVHRLYPRVLMTRWLPLIRQAIEEIDRSHHHCPYCGSTISALRIWIEWLNMKGMRRG